jgi:hypothetical protein
VKTRLSEGRVELFSQLPLLTKVADAIGFHTDELETKILRASSTPEFSHSLDQFRKSGPIMGMSALPLGADIVRLHAQVRKVPLTSTRTNRMSALLPIADMERPLRHVRFVPTSDIAVSAMASTALIDASLQPVTQIDSALPRHAATLAYDLFCTADLGVIAADNSFDLSGRTATIVNKHDLTFAHRSHWRFLLQGRGKRNTGNARYEKPENKAYRLDHFCSPAVLPDDIAEELREKANSHWLGQNQKW